MPNVNRQISFIYAHKFIAHLWFNELAVVRAAFGWVTTNRVRVRVTAKREREEKKTYTRANSLVFYCVLGRLFLSYHIKIWKMTHTAHTTLNILQSDSFHLIDNYFEATKLCKNLKAITNLKTVYFISFHFKKWNYHQSMHEISFLLKLKRERETKSSFWNTIHCIKLV